MITLKDLAEITGFSIGTISRVLNNDKTLRTSEETRNIIKTVAKSSGYKTLQSKKSKIKNKVTSQIKNCIGIIETTDIQEHVQDPYYLYLKGFVDQECFNKKIETISFKYDVKKEKYISVSNKKIDGAIVIGHFTYKEFESMEKLSKNLVFLESYPEGKEYSCVISDLILGVKKGINYLIEKNHTSIGFAGPEFAPSLFWETRYELRRASFLKYFNKRNLADKIILLECERTVDSAAQKMKEFIESKRELPSVFFAVNENVAMGLLNTLKEYNIKVPENVSILSFNNSVSSAFAKPPLSSIDTNSEYMAKAAVDLVIKQVGSKIYPPVKVLVSPSVIERESVIKLEK